MTKEEALADLFAAAGFAPFEYGKTPEEREQDELNFRGWYQDWAEKLNLDPDPDSPQHFYDYRAAFHAGAEPTAESDWHWPSEFKKPGHPNQYVDGIDTITGEPARQIPEFADPKEAALYDLFAAAGSFGDMSEPPPPEVPPEEEQGPPGYFEQIGRSGLMGLTQAPTALYSQLEKMTVDRPPPEMTQQAGVMGAQMGNKMIEALAHALPQALPGGSGDALAALIDVEGLPDPQKAMAEAANAAVIREQNRIQGTERASMLGMPGNIQPIPGGELAITPGTSAGIPALMAQQAIGALAGPSRAIRDWSAEGMDKRPFTERLTDSPASAGAAVLGGILQQGPQLATNLALTRIFGPGVAMPFIYTLESGAAYEEAEKAMIAQGLPPDEAQAKAADLSDAVGFTNMFIEQLPLNEMLGQGVVKRVFAERAKRALAISLMEGGTETLQENVNWLAEKLTYAKDQKWDMDRTLEALIPSLFLGGGGSYIGDTMTNVAAAENEKLEEIRQAVEGAITPEQVPGFRTGPVEVDETRTGPVEPPDETEVPEVAEVRRQMGFEEEVPPAEVEPAEEEAVPEEPPVYQGEERRADTEPRKPYEAMTPEEMRAELEKRDAREAAGVGIDALTGLPNRGSWNEGQKAMDDAGERRVTGLFDLNHMKKVNDSLGHRVGDQALRAVANAARAVGLNLFRYGGEEFSADHDSVETLREQAQALNDKLRTIEIEHVAEDGTVTKYAGLSLAFGIGEGDTNAQRESTADKALYADKARLLETGERTEAAGGLPPGLRIVSREAPGGTAGEGTATGGEREVRVSEGLLEQEPAQEVGPQRPFRATNKYTMEEAEKIDPGISSEFPSNKTLVTGSEIYLKLIDEHGGTIAADNLLLAAGYDAIVAPSSLKVKGKAGPESVRILTKKEVPSAPVTEDQVSDRAAAPVRGRQEAEAAQAAPGVQVDEARRAVPGREAAAATAAPAARAEAQAQAPGRAKAPVVLAEPAPPAKKGAAPQPPATAIVWMPQDFWDQSKARGSTGKEVGPSTGFARQVQLTVAEFARLRADAVANLKGENPEGAQRALTVLNEYSYSDPRFKPKDQPKAAKPAKPAPAKKAPAKEPPQEGYVTLEEARKLLVEADAKSVAEGYGTIYRRSPAEWDDAELREYLMLRKDSVRLPAASVRRAIERETAAADEALPMGMGRRGAAPAEEATETEPEEPEAAGRGEAAKPAGTTGVSPAGQGPPGSNIGPTLATMPLPPPGPTVAVGRTATKEGKEIAAEIRKDTAGLKVGMRTIADWLIKSVGVKLTHGLAQLAQDPASYTQAADILRSAENTMDAFAHEVGHAILARLTDAKSVKDPKIPRQVSNLLIEIAKLPGSRASAINLKEGFAEWVRRRVEGTMPFVLNDTIEYWVMRQEDTFRQSHKIKGPRWMDVITDAASLYRLHQGRSLDARVTSSEKVQHEKPGVIERMGRAVDAMFTGMVSGHMASQLTNKLFSAVKTYVPEGPQREKALKIVRGLTGAGGAIIGMNPVEKAHQGRLHIMAFTNLAINSRGENAGIYAYLPDGKLVRYSEYSWRMIKDQVTEKINGTAEKEAEWDAFLRYVGRRAAEARGQEQYTGADEANFTQLAQLVQEAENAHKNWKKQGTMVQDWFHAWNRAEVDNGTMSKEQAKTFKEKWEFYAPLLREDIPETIVSGMAQGRNMPIQEMDTQAFHKAISTTGKIFGQNFIQSFIDFQAAVEKSDLPWMVRKAVNGQLVRLFPHLEGATKAATIDSSEIAKIMAANKNLEMYKQATGKAITIEELDLMDDRQYETDTNGIKKAQQKDITVWSGAFDVWRRTGNYPSGIDTVVRYVNGKPTFYQVMDPQMFYSIAGSNQKASGTARFFQILLREPTIAMKASITNTLKFAIRNMVVDMSSASMNSVVNNFWSWFRPGFFHWNGLVDLVLRKMGKRKGKNASATVASQTLFSAASEAMATESFDTYLEMLAKTLKRGVWKGGFTGEIEGNQIATWVARSPGILASIIGKPAEMAWAILRIPEFSQYMEQAPRAAAARSALAIGGTDLEALVAADFATGNFVERSPSQTQADWFRVAMFLNPNVQSMYQFWRKILHPDLKVRLHYMARVGWIGSRITLLWIASQLMRPDDDEEEIALIERERDSQEKLTHMLVGGWLRIPFSRGVEGLLQSTIWNTLQNVTSDMPMPEKRVFIKELISRSLGDPMMMLPPMVTGWLEYKTGYDFHLDRSYEQPWLKYKKRPQDQYYASTPKMYRMLSEALGASWATGVPVPNASPIQIEHFLRTGLSASSYDLIRLGDKLYSGELTLDSLDKIRQAGPISSLSYHFPRGFRSPSVRLLDDVDEAMGQLRTKLKQKKVDLPIEEELAIESILDAAADLEATAELVADLGKLSREQYELKNFAAAERHQKNMTYLASSVIAKYPELANQVLESVNWRKDKGH